MLRNEVNCGEHLVGSRALTGIIVAMSSIENSHQAPLHNKKRIFFSDADE